DGLAVVLLARGRRAEAEVLLGEATRGLEGSLGPEARATLRARNHLGITHLRQGRWEQARQLFETTHDAQVRTVGLADHATLQALETLGLARREMGGADEAQRRGDAAADVLRKAPQPRARLHLLQVEHNRAVALQTRGKMVEALRLFGEVAEARARLLGEKH